jgi:hypothetical protein
MRKLLFLIPLFTIAVVARASAQQTTAAQAAMIAVHPIDTTLASRIVGKLSDSLGLTPAQQVLIHRYTWYIDSCRIAAIRVYHGTDSLFSYMVQVEHQRDSLYQRVLSDKQFVQYGSQKATLLLNN